jgi:hypothetical protein
MSVQYAPFNTTADCALKLRFVHLSQHQIYFCYMLTTISMWFYKEHEKQMRRCNMYCLTLFTVGVSRHVRSFLCQQYTPPLRSVQTTRLCARASVRDTLIVAGWTQTAHSVVSNISTSVHLAESVFVVRPCAKPLQPRTLVHCVAWARVNRPHLRRRACSSANTSPSTIIPHARLPSLLRAFQSKEHNCD